FRRTHPGGGVDGDRQVSASAEARPRRSKGLLSCPRALQKAPRTTGPCRRASSPASARPAIGRANRIPLSESLASVALPRRRGWIYDPRLPLSTPDDSESFRHLAIGFATHAAQVADDGGELLLRPFEGDVDEAIVVRPLARFDLLFGGSEPPRDRRLVVGAAGAQAPCEFLHRGREQQHR